MNATSISGNLDATPINSDSDLAEIARTSPHELSRTPRDYVLSQDNIDLATGRLFVSRYIASVPGTLPLNFRAYWHPELRSSTSLASGWHTLLDTRLFICEPNDHIGAILVDDTGAVIPFPRLRESCVTSTSGRFAILARTPNSYQVWIPAVRQLWHFPDQWEDPRRSGELSKSIPIAAITDRLGNRIRIRSQSSELTTLDHSSGFAIEIQQASESPHVFFSDEDTRVLLDYSLEISPCAGIGPDLKSGNIRVEFPHSAEDESMPLSELAHHDFERPAPIKTVITHELGQDSEYWFDENHTLVAWKGTSGGFVTRSTNAYRQTVRSTRSLTSSEAKATKSSSPRIRHSSVIRNEAGDIIAHLNGNAKTLVGYAYPTCVSEVRLGPHRNLIRTLDWTGPDKPSTVTYNGIQIEVLVSELGTLAALRTSNSVVSVSTDRRGNPIGIIDADGHETALVRDNFGNARELLPYSEPSLDLFQCASKISESSDASKAATSRSGQLLKMNGPEVQIERSPGLRAKSLVVNGRRIRLFRDNTGRMENAVVEGEHFASISVDANSPDSITLSLPGMTPALSDNQGARPPVEEVQVTSISFETLWSVIDPESGEVVALAGESETLLVRHDFSTARSSNEFVTDQGSVVSIDPKVLPVCSALSDPAFPDMPPELADLFGSPFGRGRVPQSDRILRWVENLDRATRSPGQFFSDLLTRNV